MSGPLLSLKYQNTLPLLSARPSPQLSARLSPPQTASTPLNTATRALAPARFLSVHGTSLFHRAPRVVYPRANLFITHQPTLASYSEAWHTPEESAARPERGCEGRLGSEAPFARPAGFCLRPARGRRSAHLAAGLPPGPSGLRAALRAACVSASGAPSGSDSDSESKPEARNSSTVNSARRLRVTTPESRLPPARRAPPRCPRRTERRTRSPCRREH